MSPRRGNNSRQLILALAVATAAAMAGAAPAAAIGGGSPLAIDTFSTDQNPMVLHFPPAPGSMVSSVSGGGILGGERDMRLALDAGIDENELANLVSSGSFIHGQEDTIAGSSTLTWDGADANDTLDPTGLGGIDLTSGYTQDAFDLDVTYDDAPATVTITIYQDETSVSVATFTLPGGISDHAHFVVPFSSFAPLDGLAADFRSVGAVALQVGSQETSPQIAIDSLSTDALLTAPMTAALTVDRNGNGLANRGDEVTYTTTISNPDDSSDAPAGVTYFSLPNLTSGSSLVAGSVTTTSGAIVLGNDPGDTSAAVLLDGLADGESATITGTFRVEPRGLSPLTQQGFLSSGSLSMSTDDPGVKGTADPTDVPLDLAPPVAGDDAYSVLEGATLTVAAPGVLANDSDPDTGPLAAVVQSTPAHGTLVVQEDGAFSYEPDGGFTGSDTFTYVAYSDRIVPSAPATVTVAVLAGCDGIAATVVGTNGPETLTGTAGSDVIAGRGGNDKLNGGGGNDTICGGVGDDTLHGEDGNDRLVGNDGADALYGDTGTDIADYAGTTSPVTASIGDGANDGTSAEHDDVRSDVERIAGGSAADTLTGDAGANRLVGRAGNDTLDGAGGDDTLQGDTGTDSLHGGAGDDTLQGNAGDDGLTGDTGTDIADYSTRTTPVTASIGDGDNDGTSGEHDDIHADVERIVGGSAGDTLTGSAATNRLLGRAGDDTLRGAAGHDTLQGDTGNDTLRGGDGDDTLVGNAGADDLNGDAGADSADYSTRTAPVTASIGDGDGDGTSGEHDDVHADVERIVGGSAGDTLTGSAGANRLYGRAGDDTLTGAAGNDMLDGDAGDDTLIGAAGNDILYGDAGDDALDALDGPIYLDRLFCGSDDDTTSVDARDVAATDCEA